MPKRRPDRLDGLRIELNERERDLVEQAIIVRGITGTVQGLGTAVGGLGLALGIVGGVIVWKEGVGWFKDVLERDREKFLNEECSQEKYDAYINQRSREWIQEARKQGRYAPSIGDANHPSWWHQLDPSQGPVNQPLTFEVWELKTYPDNPPLLYDQWCNEKRSKETVKRRALVGTLFPPLNLVGIAQYGFKDWFSGKK